MPQIWPREQKTKHYFMLFIAITGTLKVLRLMFYPQVFSSQHDPLAGWCMTRIVLTKTAQSAIEKEQHVIKDKNNLDRKKYEPHILSEWQF